MKIFYLFIFLGLTTFHTAAYGSPSSSGYSERRGAARMHNTRRIRNIYGVNIGSSFSDPRLFGDYDGLGRNYFGSPSANTSGSAGPYYGGKNDFAETCVVTTDRGDLRYGGGMGYENGFSACEAAEYKEYLRRN